MSQRPVYPSYGNPNQDALQKTLGAPDRTYPESSMDPVSPIRRTTPVSGNPSSMDAPYFVPPPKPLMNPSPVTGHPSSMDAPAPPRRPLGYPEPKQGFIRRRPRLGDPETQPWAINPQALLLEQLR